MHESYLPAGSPLSACLVLHFPSMAWIFFLFCKCPPNLLLIIAAAEPELLFALGGAAVVQHEGQGPPNSKQS